MTRMFLTLMLIAAPPLLSADVLLIEQVRQADRMDVPLNGQSMAQVETQFGAPQDKNPAVGDPPITRWNYAAWSVYFEYDRVLFTVLDEGAVVVEETRVN